MEGNRLIEVCAECGLSLCAQGEMMCAESKNANLERKTVSELLERGHEHISHFSRTKIASVYGDPAPFGYRYN